LKAKAIPHSATPPASGQRKDTSISEILFALCTGTWFGLSLLKFGNPIILDRMVVVPGGIAEFLIQPWPVSWGYILGILVTLSALPLLKFEWKKQYWPAALLLFWFFWVCLSNSQTVDAALSQATLLHFFFTILCFFLGLYAFSRVTDQKWFWLPIIICFGYVIFNGFDQRNGGLEEMRKAFYTQPDWQTYPRDFLLKISTNRIFSTLVYPNALAGAILLFLPILIWELWKVTGNWPRVLRGVIVGLYGYLGLAALYWTGSKGGWLIAIVMLGVLTLQLNFSRKLKIGLLAAGLTLGLLGFAIKFSPYLKKGAPSVGARFVYWQAALQTARAHPILGTGPGTFQVPFKKIKPPEAEMARLVHNDYLEQATDSGFPAFIAFSVFVWALIILLYRYRVQERAGFLLWLGLLGWALQSFIEFGLYIPALSWPTFFFLGYGLSMAPKRTQA
jgi:O-antigen ligase